MMSPLFLSVRLFKNQTRSFLRLRRANEREKCSIFHPTQRKMCSRRSCVSLSRYHPVYPCISMYNRAHLSHVQTRVLFYSPSFVYLREDGSFFFWFVRYMKYTTGERREKAQWNSDVRRRVNGIRSFFNGSTSRMRLEREVWDRDELERSRWYATGSISPLGWTRYDLIGYECHRLEKSNDCSSLFEPIRLC